MFSTWADEPTELVVTARAGTLLSELEATLADAAKTASLLAHVPMKRHGEADELAGPALFLCSEASSFVNGQTITVDGGMARIPNQ